MEKLDIVYFVNPDLVNSELVYSLRSVDRNFPCRNVWFYGGQPIKLMARLIRNSSKPGWTVLDPFGGSGSTLMACEQLKRQCVMAELDPRYCDVIVDRWETFTGGKAKRI